MDMRIARHTVMPGKDDGSVSPYLRKPLRNYEEVNREQTKRPKQPDPSKAPTEPGDPGKASDLSRADLVERWIEFHGSAPPKTLTKDLLVRGIAHEMQIRQFGGLTPAEKKALTALAQGRSSPSPGHLKTGTRLYRSWQGVTQEVLVSESSYSWRGKSYASLSEVARAITGTRWSGPRFFGVKA